MPNNHAAADIRQAQHLRLHRLGAPGHADFHRATLAKAATSALLVSQWATLVAVVAAAYRGDGRDGLWAGAALFFGVAIARVACETWARRHADTGGAAVTAVGRQRSPRPRSRRQHVGPDSAGAPRGRVGQADR